MGQSLKEDILGKLDQLPDSALREVLDFVEFISKKVTTKEDPLLAVAGTLSGNPLSAEEIERQLYGDGEEHQ